MADVRRDMPAHETDSPEEIPQIRRMLADMQTRLGEFSARLAHEQQRCAEAEAARRDAEARYSLAVDRANDGFWERDLSNDSIRVSARWVSMLGYREGSLTAARQWQDLLHPDDRDGILIRLANHIEGLTPTSKRNIASARRTEPTAGSRRAAPCCAMRAASRIA